MSFFAAFKAVLVGRVVGAFPPRAFVPSASVVPPVG